ncbi:transposase [Chelatococcus sp. GCM10030263]|uniref:helix-turn-helix domain-containing protein n=1 Tax=Chelatococcus sp. GCM10030263 TaxID=3273387 RepID=UPI003622AB25
MYDGGSRAGAARLGGVTLQIVRDWVLRFNARGPDGLLDRKTPGPTPRLTAEQRGVLAALVESGTIPAVHGTCASGWPIWCNGCSRSSGSPSARRR